MKKLALLIMSLTCVLLLSSCNKMIFESNGDGTCSIKSSTGFSEKEIVIPSESPKGDTVTEISSNAFSSCEDLTSVTIPDSVTSMGDHAFSGCSSLTSITIPDSVTSIGDYAFEHCRDLTSVTIGNSVTSIGDYAFGYCTSLTSITIPDSVLSIGDYAFLYCTSLTNVTIPDSVTSIGEGAFFDCSGLTSVHITDIARWCGISFASIASNPLYYAKNLYLNGNLVTELTIPDGVSSIGNYAFYDCTSLKSVTISDSVTSIGDDAFHGCSSLTTVYYAGTKAEWSKIGIGLKNSNLTDATRYYYSETEPMTTGNYWHYDENGDIVIWPKAFSEGLKYTLDTNGTSYTVTGIGTCTDTDIKIPPTYNGKPVTSIGYQAFDGCLILTSITIPDSVLIIDAQAFEGCLSLTSVTISNSVLTVGNHAFEGCLSLTSITIPNSVLIVGDYAFKGCLSLTSVTIGNSVTSIGFWAFYDCSNLTTVYYAGTKAEWSKISISSDNSNLTSATRYYYSETVPTTAGNYWHYDGKGKVVVWLMVSR